MSETQLTEKQKRLLAEKKQHEAQGTMKPFNSTVFDVGIPARVHYPNKKDANGKTIYEGEGDKRRAVKSEKPDGYAMEFAVFGQQQFVQVVMPKALSVIPGESYKVTGFGYDMGTHFYIKQEPHVRNC